MVTIKDVAKRAGVSTATVSHVINQTRAVLPETRDQVMEAVEALNYRPNAVARGLMTNNTMTIGVVIADVVSPFFAMLLRDLERLLSERGYNLFVCNTYEEEEREVYNLQLLLDKRVDGVIITPTGQDQDIYAEFNHRGIPMVFIDRKPRNVEGSFVGVDNYRASFEVTKYLIELGHRRIGMVSLAPETSAVSARIAGYHAALEQSGIGLDLTLSSSSNFQIDIAIEAVTNLLMLPNRPTAIIAASHVATLGALHALHALDLYYPRDVSLVCFDNSRWTAVMRPALTVVTKPISEMAALAVETLLDALRQVEQQRKRYEPVGNLAVAEHFMESIFTIRDSCARLTDSAESV